MMLAESMLKYVINYVLENAPEEMAFFNNFVDKGLLDRLRNVVENDFARVTYTEAIDILSKHNDKFDYKVSWGCDYRQSMRDTLQSRFTSACICHRLSEGDKGLLHEAE